MQASLPSDSYWKYSTSAFTKFRQKSVDTHGFSLGEYHVSYLEPLLCSGEKPYHCPHEGCAKAFAQLSNLQNHVKQHEKSSMVLDPSLIMDRDDSKPYVCRICQRRFATETSLNKHAAKVSSVTTG